MTSGMFRPATDKRRDAVLRAIKDFKPTPEYLEKLRKDAEEREAYMALPKHGGNCHCARCMSEFMRAQP